MSKQVMFIGGFQRIGAQGHAGGQTFACTSLVESEWGQTIDWIKIDTTAETNAKRRFSDRLQGALKRLLLTRKLLRKHRPKLVLIFCSSGFSFVEKGIMARMAKRRKIPVVFAPRSGLIMNDLERSRWMKHFVIKTIQKVDRLVCQGESWQTFYTNLSGEPASKFAVIHNWLIPEPYLEAIPKREMGDTKSLKVLFLGWITPNKGIFDLLDAAEQLRDKPIKLILGGKGTHFEEMQEAVAQRDLGSVVELRGWITGADKMKAFRECDAFILPSYREGYPNALLEAMAAGLPCIASAISSIPDLITDGKNGFLIEPGDSDRMAELFLELLQDPEKRFAVGMAGRQRILENNSLQTATQKIGKIFAELTS